MNLVTKVMLSKVKSLKFITKSYNSSSIVRFFSSSLSNDVIAFVLASRNVRLRQFESPLRLRRRFPDTSNRWRELFTSQMLGGKLDILPPVIELHEKTFVTMTQSQYFYDVAQTHNSFKL